MKIKFYRIVVCTLLSIFIFSSSVTFAGQDNTNDYELGIESITDYQVYTQYGNLKTSTSCVEGLAYNLYPITLKFNLKNKAVWDSDFLSSDSSYVDNVDIMAYCGHGLSNGPFIDYKGTDGNNIVEYKKCRWGDKDLEFALMWTCNSVTSSADYLNVMNGLHVYCGFGSTMLVTAAAGTEFALCANPYSFNGDNMTVKDAWLEAAYRQQASGENTKIRAVCHSSTVNSRLSSRPADPPSWHDSWGAPGYYGSYYVYERVKP